METLSVEKKKEIVAFLLDKGIIVSQDFISSLEDEENLNALYSLISSSKEDMLFLNKDLHKVLKQSPKLELNFKEFEQAASRFEKTKNKEIYDKFISFLKTDIERPLSPEAERLNTSVIIKNSFEINSKKWTLQDFVSYFNARFKVIEGFLRDRQELSSIISINRLKGKGSSESVSIIGLVKDKQLTKNKNIILTIEDMTDEINVLVNKSKPELLELANDLVMDETVGIVGNTGDNIIFANNILQPDIPMTNEFKKSPEPGSAVFISDIHFGSTYFLQNDFEKFISWLKGDTGSEKQKELAKSVKYIFIIGDLVDGVGIYPGQEKDLMVKDVKKQYEGCADYLKQIPSSIQIIICPGNHDAMRIAEPQPVFSKTFSEALHNLPNVTLVSNPSLVNIHSSKTFSGFDVLLYHGYSFDYYIANVDSIRNSGGYDRADLVMKFLLKRRHLAPTHTSTLYIPHSHDPLVIDKIPDFFVTGHIHKTAVSNYRNITLISGSCWQSTTPFQEKVGHHPEPSRVPLVDFQTRKIKILKFTDD